jgi:hypothetical protein
MPTMKTLATRLGTLALMLVPLVELGHADKRRELADGYAPRRVEVRHCGAREWVPGQYVTRCERVWIPGCTRQEWVPARHDWRTDFFGRPVWVLVQPGYWTVVTDPGRYELREVREWVPGHWRIR